VGLHHLCIDVPSREAVDERARWLEHWQRQHRQAGGEIESPPREYPYTPGYYAVFFYDPDQIKLELLHRPTYQDAARRPGA
jgi:catechol 2,3-dioxygenase-like lactoylglutathione lyase family enzyme